MNLRYLLGQLGKLLGICRDCRSRLARLPNGQAVCTHCRHRY